MKLRLAPGLYVVAVSGGVDSMVLLDLLRQLADVQLVVAHYDHGIREDSAEDRTLVQAAAQKYKLPFLYEEGRLGAQTSEAVAREARYTFLRRVKAEQGAQAIITAHHQDDMLETAIINMLRGTNRKGLSALGSGDELLRPLLEYTKKDIVAYARTHKLLWREDSTNADERYLRNYIRKHILPKFGEQGKAALLQKVRQARQLNQQIDDLLTRDLELQPAIDQLKRKRYIQLPYAVASEMMAAWLRRNGITTFDRTLIDRLVIAAKTARPGKQADVNAGFVLEITRDNLKISSRKRS
jgi:tRNA(Ile)-lysidine synthetase-like protein